MTYRIEFTKDGSSITLPADQLNEIDLPSEHSVINEWEVTIPASPGFEEWTGAEAYIRYDGDLVYRGELEKVQTGKQSGETILRGTDTTRKLRRGGADIRYQSIPVWQAIEDYISSQTGFKGEVHEPPADTVDVDKVVHSSSDPVSDYFAPSATDPFGFDANGNLELLQTCFVSESENPSRENDPAYITSDSEMSNGAARGLNSDVSYLEWDFTPQHDIPAENVRVSVRWWGSDTDMLEWRVLLNGDVVASHAGGGNLDNGPLWMHLPDVFSGDGYTGGGLQAGTTYTLRWEATGTTGTDAHWDVVAVNDDRYSYFFDNDNGGSGGYLDGPELYPVDNTTSVQHKDTYNVRNAAVTTTIDDTSGGQAIQASNDGGTTYIPSDGTEQNTDSIDVRFADTYGSLVESKLTLSRYGSRTTATPQEGYQGQTVSSYELAVTTNDLPILNDRTYTGSHYENLQELHKDGRMRFVVPPDESEKRVISFATGEIVQDEDWKTLDYTRSVDKHDYANVVTAYGGKDDSGNRLVATAKDQTAISNDGGEIPAPPLFEPRITNDDDLRGAARTELSNRVSSGSLTGSVDIAPKRILPGYSYHVPELDGETLALERVTYKIGLDDRGSLDFEGVTDIATEFSRISAGVQSVKDAF